MDMNHALIHGNMKNFKALSCLLLVLSVSRNGHAAPPAPSGSAIEDAGNGKVWWAVASAVAAGAAWVYDHQTCAVPLGAEGRCLKKCKDLGRCYGACDWPACVCVTRKAGCPPDNTVCRRECPN